MDKFEKYGVKASKWALLSFAVYMLFHLIGVYVLMVVLLIIFQTVKK